MKISSLCHIKFTDRNGTESDFVDGGIPIVPLDSWVFVKEIAGADRFQNAYIVNEKTKVETELTGGNYIQVDACAIRVRFKNVPCGEYRLLLNKGFLNSETKSCRFRIIHNTKGVVTIRTTNFEDVRYRTRSTQEYCYYYAYLSNFVERMNESVVKYDDGKGAVIPLISHTFKTFDFSTTATCQHTIMMLQKISNNDFINISYIAKTGNRVFYELKRTTESPSTNNYERSNQGTFSCTFIGERVESNIRNGIFVPRIQPVVLVGTNIPKNRRELPISEFCHKTVFGIEFDGYSYNPTDIQHLRFDNVTEIPDNFYNFRKIPLTTTLFNTNRVKKIGKGFGSRELKVTAFFENVESIGKGFQCNSLKGLIKLPQTLEKFAPKGITAKIYGDNLIIKDCDLATFSGTGVTISRLENCSIGQINVNFTENAVIENCVFKPSSNIALPPTKGLVIRNCEFKPISHNRRDVDVYSLDLSNFVGTIENSFHLASKDLTLTESALPTYKVDNNSFTGVNVNSAYLKEQIDSIKRNNTSGAGVFKNKIDISGIREGVSVNIEAVDINSYSIDVNNRKANQSIESADTISFQLTGNYKHSEHFLEGGNFSTAIDLRNGNHEFSNYFMNELTASKIEMYYSQFIELCKIKGFNPNSSTDLYIYDDSEVFDLYYFNLFGNTLGNQPDLYFDATLTEIMQKLTDLGYPSAKIHTI